MTPRGFASDNYAGVHPEVMAALARVNDGHAPAYGYDGHTRAAVERVRAELGERVEVFFVFGGTGANVLGLEAVMRPHQAVICPDGAHINVDECAAPERLVGCKLVPVPTRDGKLTPALVRERIVGVGVEHHVQPRVVSISQTTEYGTVYTPGEVRALADCAHEAGLLLHMDGARLANAAAALGVSLRAITGNAAVDVLSFGGTKNGGMGAEAVVFFHPAHAADFRFIRKQGAQLASKMRFLAAQFEALLTDDLWLRNARHANAMAHRLADAIRGTPGLIITQPVGANAVFATLPAPAIAELQRAFYFHVWNEARGEVRWMTAWDTTEEDVDRFGGEIRKALGRAGATAGSG